MDINSNYVIHRASPSKKIGVIPDKRKEQRDFHKKKNDQASAAEVDDEFIDDSDNRVKGVRIDKYV